MDGTARRAVAAALTITTGATGVLASRHSLGRGATPAESGDRLPGDELLPVADLVTTRAVTVGAPTERLWCLLTGRCPEGHGWLGGPDCADADQPGEPLAVGHRLPVLPGAEMTVQSLVPGAAVVLLGEIPARLAAQPADLTWTVVLRPVGEGATRLLVRERYAYRRGGSGLLTAPVGPGAALTDRLLEAVARRAEQTTVAARVG